MTITGEDSDKDGLLKPNNGHFENSEDSNDCFVLQDLLPPASTMPLYTVTRMNHQ